MECALNKVLLRQDHLCLLLEQHGPAREHLVASLHRLTFWLFDEQASTGSSMRLIAFSMRLCIDSTSITPLSAFVTSVQTRSER